MCVCSIGACVYVCAYMPHVPGFANAQLRTSFFAELLVLCIPGGPF